MASASVTKIVLYAEGDSAAPAVLATKLVAYAEADTAPDPTIRVSQIVVYAEAESTWAEPASASVTKLVAYAEAQGSPVLLATAQGAHVELWDSDLYATAQGAHVETTLATMRATAQGIHVEFLQTPPNYRVVQGRVWVDWDGNGVYTEESDNLVSARGSHRLVQPDDSIAGGSGMVDSCMIMLHNNLRRYSVRNAGGALYADIASFGSFLRPMYAEVKIGDGPWVRVFTGYVRQMTESAATATTAGTVALDCRSREDILLTDRQSSTQAELVESEDAWRTEDWHIIRWLEKAGLVDGTDFVSFEYARANSLFDPLYPQLELSDVRPTIDYGLFPIVYSWLDDESPLADCWKLAGAGMGWFYCDPDGVFRYRNAAGITNRMAMVQFGDDEVLEFDEKSTRGLRLWYEDSELYSRVTVESQPREQGATDTAWQPDRPPVVPAESSLTLWAKFSNPLAENEDIEWSAYSHGGQSLSGDVTLTATWYAQRVKLVFANASVFPAVIHGLTISGRPLAIENAQEIEQVSTGAFWTARPERSRSISSNRYIQTQPHAETALKYLHRYHEIPRLFVAVDSLDDPNVRVGRRIGLAYPNGVTGTGQIVAVVTETDWTLSQRGFSLNAAGLEVGNRFTYQDHFVVDYNTLDPDSGLSARTAPMFH